MYNGFSVIESLTQDDDNGDRNVTYLTCFTGMWTSSAFDDKFLVSYFHLRAAHASLIPG